MFVIYYITCQYEGIHTLIKKYIENYSYIYIYRKLAYNK